MPKHQTKTGKHGAKMKRALAIALLCAATQANAHALMKSLNVSGGTMVITDEVCTSDSTTKFAYSVAANQEPISGCWAYDSDTESVFIRWSINGQTYDRTYPYANWTSTDYFKKKIASEVKQ